MDAYLEKRDASVSALEVDAFEVVGKNYISPTGELCSSFRYVTAPLPLLVPVPILSLPHAVAGHVHRVFLHAPW